MVQKQAKDKTITIKADRNILQRLIVAYEAARPVDLSKILQHELMLVPVALAEPNGCLRSGNKAAFADVLISNIDCPSDITLEGRSCLVIDGQARVVALGKPDHVW